MTVLLRYKKKELANFSQAFIFYNYITLYIPTLSPFSRGVKCLFALNWLVKLSASQSGGTGSQRKGAINLTQHDMWLSRSWLKTPLWKCHEPTLSGEGGTAKASRPIWEFNLVCQTNFVCWSQYQKITDTTEINKDCSQLKPFLTPDLLFQWGRLL